MNPTIFYPLSGGVAWFTPLLCISLGLLLAFPALALTTPRRWWRQPTMANGALLLAVSMLCSWLVLQAAQAWREEDAPPASAPLTPPPRAASAGGWYVTHQGLHLRSAPATSAPRIATLPAGLAVWRSGQYSGDWWRICYTRAEDGVLQSGWASSLWLRRPDERQPGGKGAGKALQCAAD
ncbi:SH3 domain-containing protein [Massilia sp. W12]|uniref:SH3 domain-containing protein n=1 Tax=Massilia sp. W12 TaxID=3126507 RepID=UPI0030CF5BDA